MDREGQLGNRDELTIVLGVDWATGEPEIAVDGLGVAPEQVRLAHAIVSWGDALAKNHNSC